MTKKSTIGVSALLWGCGSTFHHTPYLAYPEVDHPLADTAVFSAHTAKNEVGEILAVDGKATPCHAIGCPTWVRVLPGAHKFLVRYRPPNSGLTKVRTGFAQVPVEDMKAQHVYVTSYQVGWDKFSASTTDLGENPTYGVTLGQTFYPVTFQ